MCEQRVFTLKKRVICLKCGDFIEPGTFVTDMPGWVGYAHRYCPEDEKKK